MPDKAVLRKTYLEKRLTLTAEEYARRNASVIDQVCDIISAKHFRYVHTFLPIKKKLEVDTYMLIDKLKDINGLQIMVPKTESNGQLSHYVFNDKCKIEINNWGIPEPTAGEFVDPKQADIILVPMVIGDKSFHRIGYGKGYYDRLLAKSHAFKLGVCLQPLLDSIPFMEPTDITLDKIIYPLY